MKHISTSILLIFCLTCQAEEILFSSKYSGELDGYHIVSTRKLILKDDGSYRFISVAKHTIGSITEYSDFELKDGLIYPQHYHYLRSIIGFKKEEWIDYDWGLNQATYKRKGKSKKTAVHKLVHGMLDPSLYQLQLQRDAWLSEGRLNDGKVDYTIIKHKKIKQMPFKKLGEDDLIVAGVTYKSIKVQVDEPGSEKITTAWLIPKLNYHIGKISHQDEDGDTYEILLEEYEASDAIFTAIYPKKTPKPQ